jgi:DNA-binding transcriptional LysR family regulator
VALADYTVEPRTLHAVYPSREHLPERVRALVRFLKERLAPSP